jgi:hypothetical protein
MKTGNGKIANLPAHIRDELNYRLADGDPGNELVEWLNSNPEVVKVIRERFDGTPISEQNLSEWRKRGYQKWLAHRNMFDESNALGDNAGIIAETGIDCDKLLLTLTAAYAEAIQNWIVTPCEQMTYKLAVYKNLTNGVIALRRAEIQKVRLEIERERLELLREKRGNKSGSSEAIGRGAGGGKERAEATGRDDNSGLGKSRASKESVPASPRSGSESHSCPATAAGASPAASLSPSTPACIPPAEHLPSDSPPGGGAAFDDTSRPPDSDIRTPSEPYGIGALRQAQGLEPFRQARGPEHAEGQAKRVETAGGGPGQGEPSAPTAVEKSAPVIPEPDETPGPDPGSPSPPPAISYEFWRELRSPSFAGVPRGGPSRWRPGAMGVVAPSAESPRTPPPPAPQPLPAVNPGVTRPAPTLTRPFVPNQVRPRDPNKTVIATRPVPQNTTIGAAR